MTLQGNSPIMRSVLSTEPAEPADGTGAADASGAADATLSRRERKAIETRAAILDAACKLIEADGYEAATIERIAEAADVAPRTFFRYFPNKEAILFAEFDAARDAMVQALLDRPNEEDVLESIAIVLRRFSLDVDRRWDEFAWIREVTGGYAIITSPERIVANIEVGTKVAAMIADRLGVTIDEDPRPGAWAKAIMASFGQAALMGPGASRTGSVFDLFIEILDSTSQAMIGLSAAAKRVGSDEVEPLSHTHVSHGHVGNDDTHHH